MIDMRCDGAVSAQHQAQLAIVLDKFSGVFLHLILAAGVEDALICFALGILSLIHI